MLDMYFLGEQNDFGQHYPNVGPTLALRWFRVVGQTLVDICLNENVIA